MQTKNPLANNIQFLKGVGPKRAGLLKKLGINTIEDLLTYFPRQWEDRSQIVPIAQAKPGEKVLICGRVELFDILKTRKRLKIFKVAVSDQTGIIYALWFKRDNPNYDVFSALKKNIRRERKILIYGNVLPQNAGNHKELNVETYQVIDYPAQADSPDKHFPTNDLHLGKIVPLYHLTEGLNEEFFRELVKSALNDYRSFTANILPKKLEEANNLLPYQIALELIHFPKNFAEKEEAYRRLAFEELFLFHLAIMLKRQQVNKTLKEHTYQIKRYLLTPFRKNLGFDFTPTQKKVINEIFFDLQSKSPMNRLLQGDVGSGKTVVALSAMLLAAENNYQSVFLAPTEILAEQHYLTFKNFLRNLPVNFALLTGKTKKTERKRIFEKLKTGETSILVGTHALIEEKVVLNNLKLAVIDEQHRFGVMQRAKIREKGKNPDVLVLTATPIPRSLALTLYGDLNVSLLDELPPGRKEIETLHLGEEETYNFAKKEISLGHQIYIVYPLIEESDKLELKAATSEAERLRKNVFPQYRVGLIHGQLPGREKEKIMSDFRSKKFAVLIATTVIEVGIDIPNATVMIIEHADRFGLSTLHQLRGRIGRGGEKSYCILLGKAKTEEARRRQEIMLSTTDGFRIAEEDLKLRGPGEFFGIAQHGLPGYKIADPIKDYDLLKQTHDLARFFLKKDFWEKEAQLLRTTLDRKYGRNMSLLPVG